MTKDTTQAEGTTEVCNTRALVCVESEEVSDAEWLAKGSFLTLGGSVVGRALGVGTQLVLARLLGPATFGLYAIGWALLRVGTIFTPLGLDSGVIHCATSCAATDQRRFGSVLRVSLLLAIVFAGFVGFVLGLAAPTLAHRVFGKGDLVPVIFLFALGFPFAAGLRVASASTTLSHSLKYSVYAESLAQPATNLLLVVAFYLIGWRLLGAAAAAVISFGASLALAVYYEIRIFPRARFGAKAQFSVMQELLEFSSIAWLGFAFVNLVPWIDRLFVGAYLAATEVGVYQAAAQASVTLSIVAGAFNVAIAPRISFLHQNGQTERLRRFYKVATKWTLYSTIPFLLVLCLIPGQVLGALYGARYATGARPLIILAVMRLVDALAGPVGILLIFTARQKVFSIVTACGLALCVLFNGMLTPHFGTVGAALATGLANTTMMLALVMIVRGTIGVWPFDARYLKGVLATGLTLGTLILAGRVDIQSSVFKVLLELTLAYIVFAGSLFIVGLDPEDREMIRMFLRYPLALLRTARSAS